MVDVGLVVVEESVVGTVLCLGIHIPAEFYGERGLGLFLHLYDSLLDVCRINLYIVVEGKLSYKRSGGVAAGAKTYIFDDVTLAYTVEGEGLCFPGLA